MDVMDFRGVAKWRLGEDHFDALCAEWKPTRTQEGCEMVSIDKLQDAEKKFYDVCRDIEDAIAKGKLHCLYKPDTKTPFREANLKFVCSGRPCLWADAFWTVDELLDSLYKNIYFPADEVHAAFPRYELQSDSDHSEPDPAAEMRAKDIAAWEAILPKLAGKDRQTAQIAIAKLRGFSHAQIYDLVLRGDAKKENKTSIVSRKITHDVAELAEKNNLPMPPGDSRK